jgi:hypothetical protein
VAASLDHNDAPPYVALISRTIGANALVEVNLMIRACTCSSNAGGWMSFASASNVAMIAYCRVSFGAARLVHRLVCEAITDVGIVAAINGDRVSICVKQRQHLSIALVP